MNYCYHRSRTFSHKTDKVINGAAIYCYVCHDCQVSFEIPEAPKKEDIPKYWDMTDSDDMED